MAFPLALATSLIPLVADSLPATVRFLIGGKGDKNERAGQAAVKIAETVSRVVGTKVETPTQVDAARAALAANPELMVQLRTELARIDAELAQTELESTKAHLEDVQDARRSQETRGERRGDIMLICAFVAIISIVALLMWLPDANQTVTGFVIGIGGMFARNIGSAFDFEFGSSRGSKNKTNLLDDEFRKAQEAVAEQATTRGTAPVIQTATNAVTKLKGALANS